MQVEARRELSDALELELHVGAGGELFQPF